ncbi:hypothetical protein ACQKND_21415 [Viridibacillus arvi]|uniref:hypothetical protein n=1 Tax=Viridibacillus arvi TaxID=263475 RepID=UPI003D065A8A
MKKGILSILFVSLISIFVFGSPGKSEAATYPDSSVTVKSGDIIHSPKSSSTYFAGHVGIVGNDGYVYHSYPNSSGKLKSSVSYYINDLFKDVDVTVRRYNGSADLENVGKAAVSLYGNVESYSFNEDLSNYKKNYCSKFVWQAYYLATGIDPLAKGYSYYDKAFILPSEFKSSSKFDTVKTYSR